MRAVGRWTDFRFASMFSGCGGFDVGFVQAGFRCVAAFDINKLAVQVHSMNLASSAHVCDLSAPVDFPQHLHGLDVILSGSPCQGFSTIGQRRLDDPRNKLLVLGGRIALRLQPKVFVAENVAGVVAGSHRQYWEALHEALRGHGYRTLNILCDAEHMGVPQMRRRMVMIAWRHGCDLRLELPSKPGGVVADVMTNLRGVANHEPKRLPPDSLAARIAKRIRPGQKLSNVRSGPRAVHTWMIPEVYGRTSLLERECLEAILKLRRQKRAREFGDADPVPANAIHCDLNQPVGHILSSLLAKGYVRKIGRSFDLVHTFNGKYRRLSLDRPSPTVDTRFGDPRYFLHPREDRPLTVREAARIQGFPDDFVFRGPEKDQYTLVGNAVPPPMAQCLAEFIAAALLRRG